MDGFCPGARRTCGGTGQDDYGRMILGNGGGIVVCRIDGTDGKYGRTGTSLQPGSRCLFQKANFAGGEVVHATHETDLPLVQHFGENRAAFADLPHDQAHIGLGDLVNKFQVF